MLRGTHYVTCSTGTVATVHWTRPEIGKEITQEEFDRCLRNMATVGLRIHAKVCQKMYDEGDVEGAEAWWKEAFDGEAPPPPWRAE